MAATENRLSKVVGDDGKSQIIIKLTINRSERPCLKSGVYIKPEYFKPIKDTGKGSVYGIVPPKRGKLNFLDVKEAESAKSDLENYTNRLIKICQVTEDKHKEQLNKEWVETSLSILDRYQVANNDITFARINELIAKEEEEARLKEVEDNRLTFFELFDKFLSVKKLSDVRVKNFRVIYRALQRYEAYKHITFDIDTITDETLRDIETFLKDEHTFFEVDGNGKCIPIKKYKSVYAKFPETRTPQARGQNTINDIFTKFRTFILWCIDGGRTSNNPFKKFKIEECVYGTPFYLSVAERNQVYNFDLSDRPQLAIQRDIFIFQCMIGCRCGDLYHFTKENVIDDELNYIARKTKDGNPVTVKVPIGTIASTILQRYANYGDTPILPFISEQKYNVAIKKILTLCGITRNVVVRNPTTGDSEVRPINEVASSHMCRRTFVGNLYAKVKDPNLVGKLSGHKEGSKAFSRYRDIDKIMREELINSIE